MDYLLYTGVICFIVLFIYGMLTDAEEKANDKDTTPHEEPHEDVPEIAPDIYAGALAYLLIDAELRALQLAQRRGDDEAGKGARV